MSFIKLDKLLDKTIKKSGISEKVQAALLLDEFDGIVKEIFGHKITNKVKPLYVKNKILTIACLSSIVAQEIKFKEERIVDELNKKATSHSIDRLRYIV